MQDFPTQEYMLHLFFVTASQDQALPDLVQVYNTWTITHPMDSKMLYDIIKSYKLSKDIMWRCL